jgi:hypothetical protein
VAVRPGAATATAAQRIAHGFADREADAAAVFGQPVPRSAPVEYVHPGALAIALGVLTAFGAVGLTAGLLQGARVSRALPHALRGTASTTFETVRREHSGQTGDYVAWATAGFAL